MVHPLLRTSMSLLLLSLPLLAIAAPNQRWAGDDSYGSNEVSSVPKFYAQTSTPHANTGGTQVTASGAQQTLPDSPALTTESSGPGQRVYAGSSYEGYSLDSSSSGRYPLYNDSLSYGTGGAGLSGTGSVPQATSPPALNSEESAGSSLLIAGNNQACSQNAVVTSTQTVSTVITETQTQTISTTVTSTQTVMVTNTATITAYVTATVTSTINQGNGVVGNSPGEASFSQALGNPSGSEPTYPSNGVVDQRQPAFKGLSATDSGLTPVDTGSAAGEFGPAEGASGFGDQNIAQTSIPASQAYGNFSMAPSAGISMPQPSDEPYGGQGMYKIYHVDQHPFSRVLLG